MPYYKCFLILLVTTCYLGCKEKKTPVTNPVAKEDIQLVASPYNLTKLSIKLSDQALVRATNKSTKDVATWVLTLNKNLKNEWEVIAGKKSLPLPLDITADQLSLWQLLAKKKGAEFDNAYLQMIINNDSLKTIALVHVANKAIDKDIRETGLDILNRSKANPLTAEIKKVLDDKAAADSLLMQGANH